jgi:hypothetical protein
MMRLLSDGGLRSNDNATAAGAQTERRGLSVSGLGTSIAFTMEDSEL